jgi:site-specific DNA-methyltransferase (adenine-specific)
MAERAIRNRTITLSMSEVQRYNSRLLTVAHPIDGQAVQNSTINQDVFTVLPLLTGQFIDLLFIDPPYNLTKSFNGRVFKQRDLEA